MRTNKLFFLLLFSFAVTTVSSQDTLYQENFETKTEALILNTPQGWATAYFTDGESVNSWSFSDDSPLSGSFSLTINDGSNYYSYDASDDCDKVAYYNTKIDASGKYDLRLSFSWKCDGDASYDYGMIMYSTDGTNWYNLSSEKFDSESTIHHVINLDISSLDGKSFYLGFEWINDDNTGYNPPFTVDDIVLTGMGSVNCTNITYPTNEASEISQNPIIVWEKTHNALGYKLYLGTDNPPTNILEGETTKSTAYYVSSDLAANTTHYLQVVPYNSGNTASSCPIISFTTIDTNTYTEWTGATNSDWSNSGNWSKGVPGNSNNVLIPVVAPGANQPTINAVASVNNITFETGGVINNTLYNLSVFGDWNDYFGTYNGSSGTVVFKGGTSTLAAYANSVYVIDGLSTDGSSTTNDLISTAGDYRGGIAVTKDYLYVTGDKSTVRMSASDLSEVTSMGVRRDGMFSDLLTGKLYTLWGNSFAEQTGAATIDATAHTVNIEVINSANLANLVATFTLSAGASADISGTAQESGVTSNDFTSPVTYTVTAEDGTTIQDWTVTVTRALNTDASLSDLTVDGTTVTGFVSDTLAYTVELPYGTSVVPTVVGTPTDANANVVVTPAAALPGTTTIDVTAEDGTTTLQYTVTFTVSAEPFNVTFNVDMTSAENFVAGTDIVNITGTMDGWSVPGTNPDYIMTDADADGIYTITLSVESGECQYKYFKNSGWYDGEWDGGDNRKVTVSEDMVINNIWGTICTGTDITAYSFAEQTGAATINATAHTVNIEVINSANLANLVATFTLSAGASANISGTAQESGVTSNDFTNPVTYTVTAEDGTTTQDWTVTVATAATPSTETDITDFSLAEQTCPATIDATAHTVNIEVINSANLANLVATFTLSTGASANISGTAQESGVTSNDFTNPVTYIVTAEDGTTTQNWVVTVTKTTVQNTETDITDFSLAEQTCPATIDATAHTVGIEVINSANLANLVATFTLSTGASADISGTAQESGVTSNDFTNPVIYKVTAEDGTTTKDWTVTVTHAPNTDASLSDLTVDGTTVTGFVSGTLAYTVELPYGTTVVPTVVGTPTDANASVVVTDTTELPGTTTIDVTAEDGTNTLQYTVTFTVSAETFNVTFNVDMTSAENFVAGTDTVNITGTMDGWSGPGTNPDYIMTDADADGIYTITLSVESGECQYKYFKNSGWDGGEWAGGDNRTVTVSEDMVINNIWGTICTGTDITAYSFAGQTGAATIDATAHTVNIEVINSANLANLVATFTLSAGASANISGTAQESGVTSNDFTSSVTYTITAEDGTTTKDWTVTVTKTTVQSTETDITAYSFAEQTGAPTINATAHTVNIEVINSANLANLVATFTLSAGASANISGTAQESGVTSNDFTSSVTYTITAEDGTTTQDWTVTVATAAALSTETDITAYSVINGDGTVPICPAVDNNYSTDSYDSVEQFTITSLKEMDKDLNISSTTIPLIDEDGNSTTIECKGGQRYVTSTSTILTYRTGIYPGYGFVCIFADNESGSEAMYVIDIQSGIVKNMGLKNITPEMAISESWATWGFGEYDGKDYYLIYKMKDEDRFRRVNLTTMEITDFADFSYTQYGLGKMSCITFSPWLSRWYFEQEGPSEFNTSAAPGEEIAGYASGSNIISIDAGQPEILTNIEINKTNSTDKLTLSSPITVNNLTITNGDLDVSTDNRKVTVKGDLSINSTGSFTKQSGTVAFEGSAAQTISGTTDFYNFDINKTSGNLTLSSDLNVSNKLALDKGLIITGTNNVYLSNSVADSLTGGADDCFVYGNLKRAIASNTDTYSFPVGLGTTTDDYYKLDFINNNITGISDLTASVNAVTEEGNDVDANLVTVQSNGNPYTDLVEGAVWNINPDNSPSGGSYGVNLYFGNQSNNLTDNKFGVLKRASGSTDYGDWDSHYASTSIPDDGAAGRTIASGYAQRTGFKSFSEYGIGTTPFSLPIELINFNAQCNNNIITLSWSTASEINNDYFTVEKSFDAQNFQIFTTVPAAGFSNSVLNYSAVDNSFENKEHHNIYYRLKQTDFDGRFSFSDIIKVFCSPDYNENLNITNLLVDNTDNTIKFSVNTAIDNKINIRLIDVYGRVLFTINKKIYSGINTVSFNNSSLTSGIYFLEVNDNEQIITKKIVLN